MTRRTAGPDAVVAHVASALAESWGALVEKFGKSAVLTALRHGRITGVLPGHYGVATQSEQFRVRARALTLWAAPHGVVTGLAACHLWGVVDEPPARITVQMPASWHLIPPRWARNLRIGAARRRFVREGIPVATAPDAVVQAWREAPRDVAASTVIAAVMRKRVTAAELLDALAERKQMPRRGQLAELIGLVENTVTSYLEYVAWRDVFPPRLFPHLRWQQEVWPNGRQRFMDAFDPEAMIDLEFDGGSTHGGVDGFERDRVRDADMRSMGVEPLHFTYRDLTRRPEWCRRAYLAARTARLAQPHGARA